MSAKANPINARLMGLGLVLACLHVNPVFAEWRGNLLNDPLSARPPVLDRGPILPGDAQPVACPPGVSVNEPLTLAGAVDLALCNSPQVKSAWSAIKIQVGAVGEARAAYFPVATVTASQLHTRNEFPGHPEANNSTDGHTGYASFSWRIFDFGTRAANRDAAGALLAAAVTAHDAALQKTLASVVGAYFDALTARATAGARGEARRLAQESLDATQRREKMGVAGQSDTLQARTALARAELAEQRALVDSRKAIAVLTYVVGLSPGRPIDLAEMPGVASAEWIDDLQAWLDRAISAHPAIASARARLEAARARVRQVRDEGLPTIDLTANIAMNGYPNQGLQRTRTTVANVGLMLTIPLFEGFARNYKVQSASAQAEQADAQYEDTEHEVLTDVVKAHADALAAARNLGASDSLLKAARASAESSERRYAKGAGDILELLSTQAALSDAQQERVRCLSDWQSARLRLMAAAGLLGRGRIP